jgi:RNA polymerase sigma factor (sigma-70 family)
MGIDPNASSSSLPPEKADDLSKRLNDPAQAEEAASEWFNMMFATLHSIARRGINNRLQGRYDPEDVVQSAFRSFFKRTSQFKDKSTDELKRILVTIAFCKSRSRARTETAECRDARLEERGEDVVLDHGKRFPVRDDPRRRKDTAQALDSEPDNFAQLKAAVIDGETPDARTMLALLKKDVQPEQALVLEEVFALVPDPLLTVFLLMISSHTEEEMAEILGLNRRTITRKKSRIRSSLLAELKEFGFLKKFVDSADQQIS